MNTPSVEQSPNVPGSVLAQAGGVLQSVLEEGVCLWQLAMGGHPQLHRAEESMKINWLGTFLRRLLVTAILTVAGLAVVPEIEGVYGRIVCEKHDSRRETRVSTVHIAARRCHELFGSCWPSPQFVEPPT